MASVSSTHSPGARGGTSANRSHIPGLPQENRDGVVLGFSLPYFFFVWFGLVSVHVLVFIYSIANLISETQIWAGISKLNNLKNEHILLYRRNWPALFINYTLIKKLISKKLT